MNTLAPASPAAALAALPAPTIRQKSNLTISRRILLAPVAHSVYLHRLCGADKRVMFCAEGALSRASDSGSLPHFLRTNIGLPEYDQGIGERRPAQWSRSVIR